MQDKLVLSIYGGKEIDTLIETLPDSDNGDATLPADVKPELSMSITDKLNEHLKTMVNKDSARSKFDCMTQGDRTAVQLFRRIANARGQMLFLLIILRRDTFLFVGKL